MILFEFILKEFMGAPVDVEVNIGEFMTIPESTLESRVADGCLDACMSCAASILCHGSEVVGEVAQVPLEDRRAKLEEIKAYNQRPEVIEERKAQIEKINQTQGQVSEADLQKMEMDAQAAKAKRDVMKNNLPPHLQKLKKPDTTVQQETKADGGINHQDHMVKMREMMANRKSKPQTEQIKEETQSLHVETPVQKESTVKKLEQIKQEKISSDQFINESPKVEPHREKPVIETKTNPPLESFDIPKNVETPAIRPKTQEQKPIIINSQPENIDVVSQAKSLEKPESVQNRIIHEAPERNKQRIFEQIVIEEEEQKKKKKLLEQYIQFKSEKKQKKEEPAKSTKSFDDLEESTFDEIDVEEQKSVLIQKADPKEPTEKLNGNNVRIEKNSNNQNEADEKGVEVQKIEVNNEVQKTDIISETPNESVVDISHYEAISDIAKTIEPNSTFPNEDVTPRPSEDKISANNQTNEIDSQELESTTTNLNFEGPSNEVFGEQSLESDNSQSTKIPEIIVHNQNPSSNFENNSPELIEQILLDKIDVVSPSISEEYSEDNSIPDRSFESHSHIETSNVQTEISETDTNESTNNLISDFEQNQIETPTENILNSEIIETQTFERFEGIDEQSEITSTETPFDSTRNDLQTVRTENLDSVVDNSQEEIIENKIEAGEIPFDENQETTTLDRLEVVTENNSIQDHNWENLLFKTPIAETDSNTSLEQVTPDIEFADHDNSQNIQIPTLETQFVSELADNLMENEPLSASEAFSTENLINTESEIISTEPALREEISTPPIHNESTLIEKEKEIKFEQIALEIISNFDIKTESIAPTLQFSIDTLESNSQPKNLENDNTKTLIIAEVLNVIYETQINMPKESIIRLIQNLIENNTEISKIKEIIQTLQNTNEIEIDTTLRTTSNQQSPQNEERNRTKTYISLIGNMFNSDLFIRDAI